MIRLFFLCILVLGLITTGNINAQVMNDYCTTPPFVTAGIKPNVLVILDNSNSMDEDFFGNAAGSYNSTSKMVVGKKALKDIITQFKGRLRLGLATFKVGSDVSSRYISNSPYFASYQLKSYCPDPPSACVDWCKTGDATSKATCATDCQGQNASFDPDYFDEIITANGPPPSDTRSKYCNLIYPKTQLKDITGNSYTYYKQALPMYTSSQQGTSFCYSESYGTAECVSTTVGPYQTYKCYHGKTDTSDDNSGYSDNFYNNSILPTDSDIAAGYKNFGRRMTWYHIGRTWFKNSSPGDGYMHANVNDLVDTSGSDTTTFTNVIAKLDPKEGNATGYMSCSNSDKNTCSYIISAGLTPTAGVFQTAINYFQGTDSPIQYSCQNNFVVFVTDGLPSVNESGAEKTADELVPGVQSKITALTALKKYLSGTEYTFDIKTYVLGVGLTTDAKTKLEMMATSGGTHAYYADDAGAMEDAFTQIFEDIIKRASSGTAASVLASSEGSGANLLQAVFYPKRLFTSTEINWTGVLQNLWYYIDPYLQSSTIREDTNVGGASGANILNLTDDYAVRFYFDSSDNKTKAKRYSSDAEGATETLVDTADIEDIKNLWEAGSLLFGRSLSTSPRTIYTTTNKTSFLTDNFSTTNKTTLRPFLNVTTDTDAENIINYVHGVDQTAYRNRTVTISGTTGVWKLGDIVSSTPRLQSSLPSNGYHLSAPDGYADSTYLSYIKSTSYLSRGMVYAGANDGMLHAFKLGTLSQKWSGQGTNDKAKLTNPNATTALGSEVWSFIPKNALPYLKYLADPSYCHLFYIDLPPLVVDTSVPTGSGADISTATKTSSSWKTILIGGMGLGGASSVTGSSCTSGAAGTCVKTPITDPSDTVNNPGLGYSSYFAINVTDPASPSLLWEFSDPALGFSTSGPAIIRIGDADKNGKWFAVFASGPTGPIDTTNHQFLGVSNQNLKLFAVDLYTGSVTTIDTGISNAFGGSLYNAVIDIDKGDVTSSGRYSDDVLYLGYTQKDSSATTWTKGGVLRILTKQNADPAQWAVSTVISGIGPVTSAVTKLQDRTNKNLWLYFGSGRFYYRYGTTMDDASGQRALYGLKEPCYTTSNAIDTTCTTSISSGIDNQSGTTPSSSLTTGATGWYINLDASSGTSGAERVITDPLAVFSGAVFFTTYAPSCDICSFAGNTYIWAVKYDVGNAVGGMTGKAVTQVSTGAIKELDLSTAFTEKGSRRTSAILGMPPKGQGLSVLIGPRPLRKYLHIREK